MGKILCLLLGITHASIFDNKVITSVRHAIEKNLDYIEKNYDRITVDCLFGVVLTRVLAMDVYENGTYPMDDSTLRIIEKTVSILKKSSVVNEDEFQWIAKDILDYQIWLKDFQYKNDQLDSNLYKPDYQVIQKIYEYENLYDYNPDTDYCLQDIIHLTGDMLPKKCFITSNCWMKYYGYDLYATGYTLTHKLLLLQVAKARKCQISKYTEQTKQMCSLIFTEVYNMDFFAVIGDMFDLFMEGIVLCGYEGYTEFFNYEWLYYILKAQRRNGCYPAILSDRLKTRLKRNWILFEDGCVDHTTGVGAAALALHYNYIIRKNYFDFERNMKEMSFDE